MFNLINIILYLFFILTLLIYILNYFKLITNILDEIEKKMNLRNDNISVEEMFLQKIKKLKIIITLYQQDINQAIVDLNFIYDNYKKFIEEKNKEMAKYLKKGKYINEPSNNTIENKIKKAKFIQVIKAPHNKRHFYFLLIYLFLIIILNVSLLLMWMSYSLVSFKITHLIQSHGKITDACHKILNYYQLMIFHNITIEDINSFERYNQSAGQDLFSNIYTNIESLYRSKKFLEGLEDYEFFNIDHYYNFTCPSYYNFLYNTNNVLLSTNNSYKEFLISVCEYSDIFKSTNYKLIFSILLEFIQNGIKSINDRSYERLIEIKNSNKFIKVIIYYITVYNYALEILGIQIQRKTSQQLFALKMNYINIGFSLNFALSCIFILIIIIEYICKINSEISKIYELKKVFKVCNKKD